MFSAPSTPPLPHSAQQGQMIQFCPVSADNVTQQNLDNNSQYLATTCNSMQPTTSANTTVSSNDFNSATTKFSI